ncbi:formate dehydrogenase subunit delta [Pseudonocardia endophytica]|uniref:Formate dehydrogenase subunit delta n=1 Tax=Pseudonocardia endophytica TaxID=401976 RepID=A0A4R1HLB3_PSEEN|nr:formate dehydrogenase subunit delta [Pseudonocardia endophytica]TCK21295.1 formate dehydrogenase subunit delta [Pseudonocardia endophytica]
MSGGPAPSARLANEIAAQFADRNPDTAAREIADHMRTFWEPRMIEALLAVAADGRAELDPLAVRAAGLLR